MIKVINATPHAITVFKNNEEVVFEPSGIIPRVGSTSEEVESILGFKCSKILYGEVEGLPPMKDGVFYIVSAMVKSTSTRSDLIAPDTGSTAIRNDKGHIIAVKGFIR